MCPLWLLLFTLYFSESVRIKIFALGCFFFSFFFIKATAFINHTYHTNPDNINTAKNPVTGFNLTASESDFSPLGIRLTSSDANGCRTVQLSHLRGRNCIPCESIMKRHNRHSRLLLIDLPFRNVTNWLLTQFKCQYGGDSWQRSKQKVKLCVWAVATAQKRCGSHIVGFFLCPAVSQSRGAHNQHKCFSCSRSEPPPPFLHRTRLKSSQQIV